MSWNKCRARERQPIREECRTSLRPLVHYQQNRTKYMNDLAEIQSGAQNPEKKTNKFGQVAGNRSIKFRLVPSYLLFGCALSGRREEKVG